MRMNECLFVFKCVPMLFELRQESQIFFLAWCCLIDARCSSPLIPPTNGNVSCTSFTDAGSVCTYSCDPGYRLSGGSANRTCGAISALNATWAGSPPNCTRKYALEII